jgi:hypothetical protein
MAAALLSRGIGRQSTYMVVGAALFAALCFTIKPSGAVVMAVIGLAALVLLLAKVNWQLIDVYLRPGIRGFVGASAFSAIIIYGGFFWAALNSAYFSNANLNFGTQAIVVMRESFPSWIGWSALFELLRHSFGFSGLMLLFFGLWVALRARARRANFIAAVISIGCGVIFWLYTAGSFEIRYIAAFFAMAIVFLAPAVVDAVEAIPKRVLWLVVGILVLQPAATTLLLLQTTANPTFQAALGVNLTSDPSGELKTQVDQVVDQFRAESRSSLSVYVADVTDPLRKVLALAEYRNVNPSSAFRVQSKLPIDWQRPHGHRLSDMVAADVIAFQPVKAEDLLTRASNISFVANFDMERVVVGAWLSKLGTTDGIMLISDGQVRFLRVMDRARFSEVVSDFRSRYSWSDVFEENNPTEWWTLEELRAVSPAALLPEGGVAFGPAESAQGGPMPYSIVGAQASREAGAVHIAVWIQRNDGAGAYQGWTMFGHLIDGTGSVVANAQVELDRSIATQPGKALQRLELMFALPESAVDVVGIGIFVPNAGGLDHLYAHSGDRDWGNRRLLVRLAL